MTIIIVYRTDTKMQQKGNKNRIRYIQQYISYTPPPSNSEIQIQQIIHRFIIRFINLLRQ